MTLLLKPTLTMEVDDSNNESDVSDNVDTENKETSSENSENESELEDNGLSNAGWADSISKILKTNKPKGKKTIVLSKAKKLTDVKKHKTQPAGFEVLTRKGEIKEEEIDVKEKQEESDAPPKKKRRELPNLRKKPSVLEKDRERTLQKVATKGVVQLFNAVKMQQKEISAKLSEAGPLEVRKEKVLKNIDKRAFLDVLMGEKSQNVDETVKSKREGKQSNTEPTWSVLRDDFMMGAKMKDWDKELEKDDEVEEYEHEIESD